MQIKGRVQCGHDTEPCEGGRDWGQRGIVWSMSRSYREEQPSPLDWGVQGRRWGMPARRTLLQVGPEECWENPAARVTK